MLVTRAADWNSRLEQSTVRHRLTLPSHHSFQLEFQFTLRTNAPYCPLEAEGTEVAVHLLNRQTRDVITTWPLQKIR